jgi:FkbM family methyltransferase
LRISDAQRAPDASASPARDDLGTRLALPVLAGPLRGTWWLPASGGKLARLLLGSYEAQQARCFVERVQRGDEVLDLGAAAGFYTLLAARCVGPQGRVFAFEPDATNLRFLRAHVALNAADCVTVVAGALSDHGGTERFGSSAGHGRGRLHVCGELEVVVRRLDDAALELGLHPRHVKIDVEGAELEVLRGGERLLREHAPTLYLSTHDRQRPGSERACRELLEAWGYALAPLAAGEWLCETARGAGTVSGA